MQDDDSSLGGLARVEEPAESPTAAAELRIFLMADDVAILVPKRRPWFLARIRAFAMRPRQVR